MTERERQFLERLAGEGKPTRLLDEELALVRQLEAEGLIFLVGLSAVVTPKGRRLLAREEAVAKKAQKKPMGFLDPED